MTTLKSDRQVLELRETVGYFNCPFALYGYLLPSCSTKRMFFCLFFSGVFANLIEGDAFCVHLNCTSTGSSAVPSGPAFWTPWLCGSGAESHTINLGRAITALEFQVFESFVRFSMLPCYMLSIEQLSFCYMNFEESAVKLLKLSSNRLCYFLYTE